MDHQSTPSQLSLPDSHAASSKSGEDNLMVRLEMATGLTCANYRLDSEVLTLRDHDEEPQGPVLRGVVVLCLQSRLKIEDAHLQLNGILRHFSVDPRLLSHREKILEHRWMPFVGVPGKSMLLPPGNYEWPFEYTFPPETIETVEGIPEMSITYALKATINRGKMAHDLHAYKQIRVIRVPHPDALELTQPVGVDDVWPGKVEYSIAIPQKSVRFGSSIPVKMRFTPLLKGLDLRSIKAKLVETRESDFRNLAHDGAKKYRTERLVSKWDFQVTRESFWQDTIQESGQEGWVITKTLDLPRELCDCIQDLSLDNIKVRHKICLSVELLNPDGHVSELLATLPISVTLYPSIAFDKRGNMIGASAREPYEGLPGEATLPSYEDRIRDELYESPDSRSSLDHQLDSALHYDTSSSEHLGYSEHSQESDTSSLTFWNSDLTHEGPERRSHSSDEESAVFRELERVPSYQTAVRTPFRLYSQPGSVALPGYQASIDGSV